MANVDFKLSTLETCNYIIPPTFLISPKPQIEKVNESSTVAKKVVNFLCQSKDSFMKMQWNECTLKFFGPILGEFVSCGVDGK
jgi:hypothetical protein